MKVDQGALADIFGVSKRTIRNWQEHGMPREGRRQERQYDTEDCISWYVANRAERAAASADENGDLPPVEESNRRWRQARAVLKEIEVERSRGDLVPRSVAIELFEDVAMRIRQRLLNLPSRRLQEVTSETDRATVRTIRLEAVNEILEELQTLYDAEEEFAGEGAR